MIRVRFAPSPTGNLHIGGARTALFAWADRCGQLALHAPMPASDLLLPGRQAEAEVYSYHNKEHYEKLVIYRPVRPEQDGEVRQAEVSSLAAWRALGCRDAGRVDLRSDADGRPQFMEVNPLAGLHPQRSDLPMVCGFQGISYVQLIDRIVRSALQRVRKS